MPALLAQVAHLLRQLSTCDVDSNAQLHADSVHLVVGHVVCAVSRYLPPPRPASHPKATQRIKMAGSAMSRRATPRTSYPAYNRARFLSMLPSQRHCSQTTSSRFSAKPHPPPRLPTAPSTPPRVARSPQHPAPTLSRTSMQIWGGTGFTALMRTGMHRTWPQAVSLSPCPVTPCAAPQQTRWTRSTADAAERSVRMHQRIILVSVQSAARQRVGLDRSVAPDSAAVADAAGAPATAFPRARQSARTQPPLPPNHRRAFPRCGAEKIGCAGQDSHPNRYRQSS